MHSVKIIRLPHVLVSVALSSEPMPPPGPSFSEQEIETARSESYKRGFEDASAMVETQIVEQREEVMHLQQKTLQALADHHDTLTKQLRDMMPELTMEIVRRMLGGMTPTKEAVAQIVNEVLQGIAPGPEEVEVCLSAGDLKMMETYQAGLRERYPKISFRVDPALRPGDCIVTSKFGALDGRLETKLRSVDRLMQ